MHRSYHQWHSPALNRPMELLVFGHAGAPVIVFPTSKGRFFEYEDRGMVGALSQQIEQGWVQLYCLDSVDAESWYAKSMHPRERLYRHDQYERYVLDEVLPLIRSQNANQFTMLHGCSFGAIHAMLFGLRHPDRFNRVLAFAGLYDTTRFLDGYYDEEVHYHHPIAMIQSLQAGQQLNQLKRLEILMAIGRDDTAANTNTQLSDALWSKGIWHALRLWDGWAHDWPYWHRMIQLYINGAN
ncbi:MAG: alpha/beta hydrolase-fold protein [Roseiflexaceae bacterium]|nr:alpha/beta hydrolase-fold protein [Roseiflexaceae bacterium]